MPALTHNRVKNGFNGGRRLLNANAGIKFGRTIGATTADASRSDALVGGIGPRSKFVRRAINNRAITSKKGGCCHNMDKVPPRAILYYSSPGPYKLNDKVTVTAVFDKMMDRGRRSVDSENANRSFASAERLLMEEAPIIVLWYEEVNRLVDSNVEGFPLNKLLYLDLSEVYLK